MRSRIAAPAFTFAALLARADAALVPQLNFVSDADKFRGAYTDGDFGYTIPGSHGQVAKFPVTSHTPQQGWSTCFGT